jgi:hypothetical protein
VGSRSQPREGVLEARLWQVRDIWVCCTAEEWYG